MKKKLFALLTLLSFAVTGFGETVSISSPADLIAFANRVNNNGELTLDAVLTDNIDMTGQTWAKPIGCWTPNVNNARVMYQGHFDGQGHSITNLTYTTTQNYHGFFGVVSTGALIENFSISGTVTNANYTEFGTVGFTRDDNPTIRNVHSSLNFNNSLAGARIGGIVGQAYVGTTNIDRCTYSGTISANDNGGSGNYGGMVGIGNNNTSAICNITNCLFDGVVKNTATTPGNCTFGGMVGYSNSAVITIKNCVSIGTVQSSIYGQFWGAVKSTACSIVNSYYQGNIVNGSASTVTLPTLEATKVTNEQLASGEICYTLNGNQSENVNWFQTLIDDEYPTPNGSDIVYMNGRQHCDGTPYEGDASYSNEDLGMVTDEHTPVDGFCSVCGNVIPDAYTAVDGFFEIDNANKFKWFAAYVNQVDAAANAKLTADINLQDVEVEVIGNSPANAFKGIFDGQGHEINNYSLTVTTFAASYGYGLFGNARGATIKDFTIDGTILFDNAEGKTSDLGCGLVGWPEAGTLVQNIKSTVTIDAKISTHVGGIVGSLRDATIDRCEYAGTLKGYSSSNGVGGITGYTNLGTITNCIFSGTITGNGTGYFAGVLGYVNNGNAVMKNCLAYGSLEDTSSPKKGTLVSYLRNVGTYSNNFYRGGENGIGGGELATSDLATSNTTLVTDAQLASGEVTYKLGEAFRQTIGTDLYPQIGTGEGIVILNGTYQNAPSTIALDENNDFGTSTDFDVTSVTLARTLTAGKWEIFCVPFDMTSAEIASQLGAGTEVKELTGVSEEFDNYTLTFADASSIVAGKPSRVRVQNDVTSISLGSKTIKGNLNKTTIDDFTFVGVFTNSYAPTGSFVINEGKTSRVTGVVAIKAFRGYLTATDGVVVKTLTLDLDGIEDGVEPSTQISDRPTFSVIGNSISTYYDYIPSGYAIYYTADREKSNDIQVGDQWWMQLSRMSGLSFLANASWSGSRVAFDSSTLGGKAPFCSDARVAALGRAGNPDFIFILGGTNDWAHSANIPLGEYNTTGEFKDSLSFRGAYSLLLHKLTTRYPKAHVVCLSILPRGEAATQVNGAGWTQNDGNASIQHIAEQFGQYYIDCSTIPFSSNWSKYMISGNLHPTADGFTLMAEHITDALLSQGLISADLKRTDEVETAERLLDLSFTQDGIVNNGTFDTTIGKQGTATTTYDSENDVYYGTTQALASDYFYATYDEDSPLAEAFNKSVTWEMLVRLDALEDQNGNATKTCILGNEQDGGWCFYNSDYASTFSYTNKSGVKSSVKDFTGSRILVPGKFYHLVVTMDRTSHVIRYFVNGKLVRTGTRAATDMPLPQCGTVKGHQGMWICLGGDATSGTCTSGAENSSACSFVFARIYNGALTETAALNLYNDDVKKYTMQSVKKIKTPADLVAFANQVNAGDVAADAVLANDIDMTGVAWPAPIGFWGSNQYAYKGHFDGQGYAITNLTYTTAQNFSGLFGVLSSDALVENFSISGTITNTDYSPFGGVVGFARDNNPTIRNVHSYVNINNSKAGARVGGILGHSNDVSTVNVDRCTYSGTLDGNDSGGSGNYGGIVGYTQNATSTILNITNCLFDGKLKNSAATPGNCTFGGMVGYIGAGPKVTSTNCLSIGTVQSKYYAQFYGAVKNTTCSILNSYYQGDYVNSEASTATLPTQEATLVTDAQLASGEIAVKLGEAFGQTLGSDTYPILDAAPKVYEIAVTDAGYATFVPEANILAIPEGVEAFAAQKGETTIHLEPVTELPADNAVVVKANEGTYYCNGTDEARTLGAANDLTFSETDIAADGTQYILAQPTAEDEVGFYRATTGTIAARKGYIVSTSGVKALLLEDDDATGIEDVNANLNGKIYNIAGQRLSRMQKGVNVINNKKILK